MFKIFEKQKIMKNYLVSFAFVVLTMSLFGCSKQDDQTPALGEVKHKTGEPWFAEYMSEVEVLPIDLFFTSGNLNNGSNSCMGDGCCQFSGVATLGGATSLLTTYYDPTQDTHEFVIVNQAAIGQLTSGELVLFFTNDEESDEERNFFNHISNGLSTDFVLDNPEILNYFGLEDAVQVLAGNVEVGSVGYKDRERNVLNTIR